MQIWTEENIDTRMGRVLLLGVVFAAAVMLAGAVIFLLHHGREIANYRTFQDSHSSLQSVRGILQRVRRGDGRGVMQLAVLLMVATPVARVIFAAYAFLRIRDWLYAAISVTVLMILMLSLMHGA